MGNDPESIESMLRELQDVQPRTPADEDDPARRQAQQEVLDRLDRARTGASGA